MILRLRDGRALDYISNDSASKKAILFHHGTPGECSLWSPWLSEITDVSAIAASRPGYALSDRRKGRTVASDVEDQSELLDHLGIERFVSIGWSGGGPYALHSTFSPACKGAELVAAVGPYFEMGKEFP